MAKKQQIARCKHCGGEACDIRVLGRKRGSWVECQDEKGCWIGPTCKTRKAAIEAWNKVME